MTFVEGYREAEQGSTQQAREDKLGRSGRTLARGAEERLVGRWGVGERQLERQTLRFKVE